MFWGEPIHSYTDADALEDGTLVDLGHLGLFFRGRHVNRMTGALYAELEPFVKAQEVVHGSFNVSLRHMLETKLSHAASTGHNDHFVLPPGLWLMWNETGGWTVMKPEDC